MSVAIEYSDLELEDYRSRKERGVMGLTIYSSNHLWDRERKILKTLQKMVEIMLEDLGAKKEVKFRDLEITAGDRGFVLAAGLINFTYLGIEFMPKISTIRIKRGSSTHDHYYEMSEGKLSPGFVDGLSIMIEELAGCVFKASPPIVAADWYMDAIKELRSKPSAQLYRLAKALRAQYFKELAHYRERCTEHNEKMHEGYCKLLRLRNQLPHSVNRAKAHGLVLKKISKHYYKATVIGEKGYEYNGWGSNRYVACSQALSRMEEGIY